MREELSSLDLHFLIKEFESILHSKIYQVFQIGNTLVFQLYLSNKEKKYLTIILPNFIFLSEEKEGIGESGNFALSLRKHINNARIRKIKQKEFERIVEIELEAKEKSLKLIVELFRPGNIILCDDTYKIIMAKEYKGFGSRVIRPGIIYDYPKKEFNFLELKEIDLVNVIENSDKTSVVITLAVDLGLGGLYAEEICEIAKVDKKKASLDKSEIKRVYSAIESIKNRKIDAHIYYEKENILDITPFELAKYKGKKFETSDSFNLSLSLHLMHLSKQEKKKQHLSKYEHEKVKLEKIIKNQETQIAGMLASSIENQKKGELIYEKYSMLNNIMHELKKAREKYSWKEIKEKLKDHKLIKEIIEKDKKIILELE